MSENNANKSTEIIESNGVDTIENTTTDVEQKDKKKNKKDKQKKKKDKKKKDKKKKKLSQYLKETRYELKQVTWSSKKETLKNTWIVICTVIISVLICWGFDTLLSQALSLLINK